MVKTEIQRLAHCGYQKTYFLKMKRGAFSDEFVALQNLRTREYAKKHKNDPEYLARCAEARKKYYYQEIALKSIRYLFA